MSASAPAAPTWARASSGGLWHLLAAGAQITYCGERIGPDWVATPQPDRRCERCVASYCLADDDQPPSFALLLRQHREVRGFSRNRLAHQVGVDPSYLTRIEHGDRDPPRAHIVDALSRAFHLNSHQWDELRVLGGLAPKSVNGSGWPRSVSLLLMSLNDHRLSQEERDQLDRIVIGIVEHWRPSLGSDPHG